LALDALHGSPPLNRFNGDKILRRRRIQSSPWSGALAAGLCLSWVGGAHAFPDTPAGAKAALAEIRSLNAALLSHDSATAALQEWCAAHRLTPAPAIVAHVVSGVDKPADTRIRALLGAGSGEPIRYRRVALACGERVLSEADNWYRPQRLTPQMNRELDETDTPFGAVVAPLDFHRRRLEAKVLYAPSRRSAGRGELRLPHALIRHRAVLETPDGAPFSLVVETYTDAVLDVGS
jgi:chorismate-pyruvate lyase